MLTGRSVAVGVFETHARAQQAISELQRAGFGEGEIGIAMREDNAVAYARATGKGPTHAAEGAAAGLAAGAGMGGLWALGIAAGVLPAIGPVIAGGVLASMLASTAVGAASGTVVGALIGLGIPEEEAKYYADEFHAGRVIVSVRAGDRYSEALDILDRCGAYGVEMRANQ
jgi:hypothetical protein